MDAPGKLAFAAFSRRIYEGKHLTAPGVQHFACDRITIDLENERARGVFLLDVDGEPLGGLPARGRAGEEGAHAESLSTGKRPANGARRQGATVRRIRARASSRSRSSPGVRLCAATSHTRERTRALTGVGTAVLPAAFDHLAVEEVHRRLATALDGGEHRAAHPAEAQAHGVEERVLGQQRRRAAGPPLVLGERNPLRDRGCRSPSPARRARAGRRAPPRSSPPGPGDARSGAGGAAPAGRRPACPSS